MKSLDALCCDNAWPRVLELGPAWLGRGYQELSSSRRGFPDRFTGAEMFCKVRSLDENDPSVHLKNVVNRVIDILRNLWIGRGSTDSLYRQAGERGIRGEGCIPVGN